MHGPLQRTALLTGAALCVTSIASAQQLWELPGTFPTDASVDGTIVVGDNLFSGEYFMWTPGGGAMDIGGVIAGGGVGGRATISDDGTRVGGTDLAAGSGLHEMSYYDVGAGTWTNLGGIGGMSGTETSSGWGISGDGMSIVGLGWVNAGGAHAIQWDEGGAVFDLGSTVPDRSSRANAVDQDGDTVVGWQDGPSGFRQAAVWNSGVQTVIMTDSGDPVSEANCVSDDGTWVAGNAAFSTMDQAWRWSAATGVELLGTLGVGFNPRGFATAMTGDGLCIIGFDRGFGVPPTGGEGWVWTEPSGLVSLDDFFASQGIVAPNGLRFSLPLGVSADGRTFVGGGRSDTAFFTGWIVNIDNDTECFLVISSEEGPGEFGVPFKTRFETQVGDIDQVYPVTLSDGPVFPLSNITATTRTPAKQASRNGVVQINETTAAHPVETLYAQVLMWNPEQFPQNPAQHTNALRITVWSNGAVSSENYGDEDGMSVWVHTFIGDDGEPYYELPFSIDGL